MATQRPPAAPSHGWAVEGRLLLVFHVFDRDGRRVASARGEAAFAFHHVNAYDENDAVVVDLVGYPDAESSPPLSGAPARGGPINATGLLTRYRVPLDGGAVPSGPPLGCAARASTHQLPGPRWTTLRLRLRCRQHHGRRLH